MAKDCCCTDVLGRNREDDDDDDRLGEERDDPAVDFRFSIPLLLLVIAGPLAFHKDCSCTSQSIFPEAGSVEGVDDVAAAADVEARFPSPAALDATLVAPDVVVTCVGSLF